MPISKIKALYTSELVSNSVWGLLASAIQNILLSVFFIALARGFSTSDFAEFIIASALFQIMVSLSTMGLGQWFIREYSSTESLQRKNFVSVFFKIQITLGFIFYLLNIVAATVLYQAAEIRLLSIILGLNIIVDNLLYSVTRLNIAESKQSRTMVALTLDGGLRMLSIAIIYIIPLSIVQLSSLVILARFISLFLFLTYFQNSIRISDLLRSTINWKDLNHVVFQNWRFIVTGGVYIINWRIANLMISKLLTVQEVANYEIAFKIFSISLMAPAALSGTAFTYFVNFVRLGDIQKTKRFFEATFNAYTLFALTCFAFIYSFADTLVPWIFGQTYAEASEAAKMMFLTLIISTTSSLQANLIIALGQERRDMVYNIVNMIVCLSGTTFGLYYFRSLSTVNYSILTSILIFQLLQDVYLVKQGLISLTKKVLHYVMLVAIIVVYHQATTLLNDYVVFGVFMLCVCIVAILMLEKYQKEETILRNSMAK